MAKKSRLVRIGLSASRTFQSTSTWPVSSPSSDSATPRASHGYAGQTAISQSQSNPAPAQVAPDSRPRASQPPPRDQTLHRSPTGPAAQARQPLTMTTGPSRAAEPSAAAPETPHPLGGEGPRRPSRPTPLPDSEALTTGRPPSTRERQMEDMWRSCGGCPSREARSPAGRASAYLGPGGQHWDCRRSVSGPQGTEGDCKWTTRDRRT